MSTGVDVDVEVTSSSVAQSLTHTVTFHSPLGAIPMITTDDSGCGRCTLHSSHARVRVSQL